MRPSCKPAWKGTAFLLTLIALAGLADAADTRGTPRLVRTSTGPALLSVTAPHSAESPARLLDASADDLPIGRQAPAKSTASGLRLLSRVVVQRRPAAGAIRLPGRSVRPLAADGALERYGVIETASVDEAIELAEALLNEPGVEDAFVDTVRPHVLRGLPDDPRFSYQWHLVNELEPLFDVNADAAWDAGFSGVGVTVGIVEDSWQRDHVDLAANYNDEASQTGGSPTSHATSCAGIVAAAAFNDSHGAGIAYDAQLSSLIYGSDAQDAAALAFRNDLNDIKSNSWGPADNGVITYLPAIVREALREATETGRAGLGEVFVWSAGNGAGQNDRVDYDSYASNRFVIAVGAVGDLDTLAPYSEPGSALLVVAHSDGNVRKIYSTDLNHGETFNFGGTSAAAPLAAGVCALVLDARPDLSWRDVRHVLVNSARRNDPGHSGWVQNGAGHWVNERYGYGAVDAGAAAALAVGWKRVAREISADSGVQSVNVAIPDNNSTGITRTLTLSADVRVESVEVILNVTTTYVGDLEIVLTSPYGTQSVLAQRRGDPSDHLNGFIFTSQRHWDERTAGEWSLRIADRAGGDLATWVDWRLIAYGTPGCPGDLDHDGVVDLLDLSTLLVAFGECDGSATFVAEADLDNSGCNDLEDLARLLEHFGADCQ